MSGSVRLAELATTVILLLHVQQILMHAGCLVAVFRASMYTYSNGMACGAGVLAKNLLI